MVKEVVDFAEYAIAVPNVALEDLLVASGVGVPVLVDAELFGGRLQVLLDGSILPTIGIPQMLGLLGHLAGKVIVIHLKSRVLLEDVRDVGL